MPTVLIWRPKKPLIEAFFHAYLLSLLGIRFVGRTHIVALNQFLHLPR